MNRKLVLSLAYCVAFVVFQGCDDDDDDVKTTTTTAAEWDYENADAWGTIGYTDCAGKVQSPININTETTIKSTLPELQLAYKNSTWGVIDNGHTIQVNLKQSNKMVLNGTTYKVMQFHFHHKSEHTVNGSAYDMEMHIVHQDTVTSNLVVVGIFLKEGDTNTFLEKIWSAIPSEVNKEVVSTERIDLVNAVPSDLKYYTYTGSLTTPPCSQGIDWVVLKEPMEISTEQIEKFSSIHENNARPTQPLNNRQVVEGI
jgi:carbonic anhydrase